MKPIALYVRVSRRGDREDGKFHSPREQAERAAALIRAKGLVPGPVFEDIDVSGAMRPEDRPAMSRLLAAIDAGELGGVAAFSLDRLSREPSHGDSLVKRVTKAGGIVLTPDIPEALDSPTGEFTFGMLMQVAKLYRSQARARFATSKERAILEGIPVSKTPVGYRQRPDRRIEVDPALAPVIRDLFERRAQGAGWAELANLLGDATDRVWSLPGVQGVLKNRIYATGRLEHSGLISEHDAGAIVDEPLWQAAQRNSGPRPKRVGDSPWILPGLARCAACGYALATWTGAKRRRNSKGDWVPVPEHQRARRYRCRNRNCTEQANVEARLLERYVVEQTKRLEHQFSQRANTTDLSDLTEAMELAERRLDQVMAEGVADELGDLWAPEVGRRRKARDTAAAALGEARARTGLVETTFALGDVLDSPDVGTAERRQALAMFWKEVRVGRKARAKSRGPVPLTFVARGSGEAEATFAAVTS